MQLYIWINSFLLLITYLLSVSYTSIDGCDFDDDSYLLVVEILFNDFMIFYVKNWFYLMGW